MAGAVLLSAVSAYAQAPQAGQLQSAAKRPPLGVGEPTPWLLFDSRVIPTNFIPLPKGKKERGPITNVTVAGTWSSWTGRHVMTEVRTNLWRLDSRELGARVGRHEFKFIVNGEWEGGANRVLPIADTASFACCIAYGIVSLSFLRLRRTAPDMHRPFRVRLHGPVGVVAALMSGVMVLMFILPGTGCTLVPQEWAIVAGWTVLGVLFYISSKLVYKDRFGTVDLSSIEGGAPRA